MEGLCTSCGVALEAPSFVVVLAVSAAESNDEVFPLVEVPRYLALRVGANRFRSLWNGPSGVGGVGGVWSPVDVSWRLYTCLKLMKVRLSDWTFSNIHQDNEQGTWHKAMLVQGHTSHGIFFFKEAKRCYLLIFILTGRIWKSSISDHSTVQS